MSKKPLVSDEDIDAARDAAEVGFDPNDGIVCQLRALNHRFARRILRLQAERLAELMHDDRLVDRALDPRLVAARIIREAAGE